MSKTPCPNRQQAGAIDGTSAPGVKIRGAGCGHGYRNGTAAQTAPAPGVTKLG
jgi:hypothetical protein